MGFSDKISAYFWPGIFSTLLTGKKNVIIQCAKDRNLKDITQNCCRFYSKIILK